MDYMVCLYILLVCHPLTTSKGVELQVLTCGKHALHEVVDIAENNSETLWSALLPHQRLDLNTLKHGL